MTRKSAFILAAIALVLSGLTVGSSWAALLTIRYNPPPEATALRMCRINTGRRDAFLIPLGWVPSELQGWRCYTPNGASEPNWTGPDILARRYLEHENKSGWEVWEDVDES